MYSLRKPERAFIDRWLEAQRPRKLSYPEACGTREPLLPGGYNIDRTSIQLGQGEATYRRAVAALRGLHVWDLDWIELCCPTTSLEAGIVVATLTRQWGVWFLNPCRIVYLMEEAESNRRFCFAYGTMEGHVEHGEERFMVEWREDDSVWYEILAFSRPAHWLLKLAYPLLRRLQKRFFADSLQAIVRAVEAEQGVGKG